MLDCSFELEESAIISNKYLFNSQQFTVQVNIISLLVQIPSPNLLKPALKTPLFSPAALKNLSAFVTPITPSHMTAFTLTNKDTRHN